MSALGAPGGIDFCSSASIDDGTFGEATEGNMTITSSLGLQNRSTTRSSPSFKFGPRYPQASQLAMYKKDHEGCDAGPGSYGGHARVVRRIATTNPRGGGLGAPPSAAPPPCRVASPSPSTPTPPSKSPPPTVVGGARHITALSAPHGRGELLPSFLRWSRPPPIPPLHVRRPSARRASRRRALTEPRPSAPPPAALPPFRPSTLPSLRPPPLRSPAAAPSPAARPLAGREEPDEPPQEPAALLDVDRAQHRARALAGRGAARVPIDDEVSYFIFTRDVFVSGSRHLVSSSLTH